LEKSGFGQVCLNDILPGGTRPAISPAGGEDVPLAVFCTSVPGQPARRKDTARRTRLMMLPALSVILVVVGVQVFFRLLLERTFTARRAEVVGFALVLGSPLGGLGFNLHVANGVYGDHGVSSERRDATILHDE
jgi:hypothetical protein